MDLCTALEHSQTVGAMKVDVYGMIRDTNEHAAELFELDRINLIGRSLVELTAPEAKLSTHKRLQAVRDGEVRHSKTTKPCATINGRRFMASCEFWVLFEGNVPESLEMLFYQIPHGRQDAEILELRQDLHAVKELVMSFMHKTPININTITGGDNNVGDNR